GTDVTAKFAKPVTVAQIAKTLSGLGVNDARINTVGKAGDAQPNERYTIETQTDFGNDTPKLWSALGTLAPVDRSQSSIEAVGPSLGKEYLIKAGEALVIAIAIQFLYIAFRFGWNYIFGLVVVIALVRDAAMMIGIYAIADKRADDAFLAAVLTVIGYSVMDTIVILDRIRENVRVMQNEPYDRIVNTSILQTMTRSFNTLATVVITLVALLAFGGASLQNFAFALLVGICSGGYHSIFYSAPLVNVLRERQLKSAAGRRAIAREAAAERPRTVAEARAQAVRGVSREEILQARKERRKKTIVGRPASGPARYKRKRIELPPGSPMTAEQAAYEESSDADFYEADPLGHAGAESHELGHDGLDEYGRELDPLDAQNAGVHEHDLALGHEEINLNFDDVDEAKPPEPPAVLKHE
ncbi:MAG: protein translocase subunit SecF, partial [Candidatus Eremiobacteraeota bacterium]|nr:protein translocase subunit SecF [Candidatus Eremiobacteraeota bacterium]